MPWPTVPVVTTGLDADTDPLPRVDLLDLTQKFNQLIAMLGVGGGACELTAGVKVPTARLSGSLPTISGMTSTQANDLAALSAFIGTLLNDADASTAQSTLGISAFVKTLLDDADASTFRASIGVVVFESAQQVITSGGSLTIAHGLVTTPRLLQHWLINLTAEYGYSVGDRVAVNAGIQAGTVSSGVSAVVDATNINIRYADYSSAFNILNKTTGAPVSITNANWRFLISAYK